MADRFTITRTVNGVADIRHTVAGYNTAAAMVAGLRGVDMAAFHRRPDHIGYAIRPAN
ncbi:hypothetical protein [Nocardia acidivorans]|uniref:hypothetical protein n=1 Tax=Nocardia acidivorans TaxID=404580 RepID=UPI000AD0AC79|nr:hypothetical protein [Nocardia acidivorans]